MKPQDMDLRFCYADGVVELRGFFGDTKTPFTRTFDWQPKGGAKRKPYPDASALLAKAITVSQLYRDVEDPLDFLGNCKIAWEAEVSEHLVEILRHLRHIQHIHQGVTSATEAENLYLIDRDK